MGFGGRCPGLHSHFATEPSWNWAPATCPLQYFSFLGCRTEGDATLSQVAKMKYHQQPASAFKLYCILLLSRCCPRWKEGELCGGLAVCVKHLNSHDGILWRPHNVERT